MERKLIRPIVHYLRSIAGTNGMASQLAGIDAKVDALRQTFANQPAASVSSSAVASPPCTSTAVEARLDANVLLHQSRSALLRGMPPGAQRLLSAGCSGNWYFDWIELTYGHVPEHLGVEYYSPEPDSLPANVTWISNTASDMSAVASSSCDLIFSGQNLEHLWPEEVSGFLLEAARVLKPGGHLVMDSPNRLMTAQLNWSHPEHTIELTQVEVKALMVLAGFDVTAIRGIWLCRDARTGQIMPFDPNQSVPDWSNTERLIVAQDRPEDSFIWWVEGVRSDRLPDAIAVKAMMADLFDKHWPERVQRLIVLGERSSRQSSQGEWIDCASGQAGVVIFGPYMPLRSGLHRVTWQIQQGINAKSSVAVCEVVAGPEALVLARHEVQPGETHVSLEFKLERMTFGLQFRCVSTGGVGFSVLRRIQLDEQVANADINPPPTH